MRRMITLHIVDSKKSIPSGAPRHVLLFEGAPFPPAVPRERPSPRFSGRAGQVRTARLGGETWIFHGLGPAAGAARAWRAACRDILGAAARSGDQRVALIFSSGASDRFAALLPHLLLGDYRFRRYRTVSRDPEAKVAVWIMPPPPVRQKDLREPLRRAKAVAEVVSWMRDLGNTPANDLGPEELAAAARRAARKDGLRIRVLGKREIEREKMGGLLGVNAGAVRPPRFVVLDWAPRKRAKKTVVLVGKGICFDSGGISIKPAASMGEMKYDMMGAATAMAVVRAAAMLKLPVRLIALTPLTENLPSGSSYRPGDILRMRNGKTVEVDNTDAEGRLVLADALSYAEKFKPDVILDYATLTGAVLVALGQEAAGLMTDDDRLSRDLVRAGEAAGERLWRLPLWPEYRENIKSEWADMKNTGGRWGGTINAGVFLAEFAPEGIPWAHLDVAGVAHLEKEHAGWPAGATGFGVALTLEFLRRRYG
jgi:leucyl aminopeptidase